MSVAAATQLTTATSMSPRRRQVPAASTQRVRRRALYLAENPRFFWRGWGVHGDAEKASDVDKISTFQVIHHRWLKPAHAVAGRRFDLCITPGFSTPPMHRCRHG